MERATNIVLHQLERLLAELQLAPSSQKLILDLLCEMSPMISAPPIRKSPPPDVEPPKMPQSPLARRHRDVASTFYEASRHRERLIGPGLLHDPVWLMMLHSFIAAEDGRSSTVEDLCRASSVPPPVARRYIALMERRGLLRRLALTANEGGHFVEPSDAAIMAVAHIIDRVEDAASR